MCGIVGFAGAFDPKIEKAVLSMWYADVIRGADSSGVVYVDKDVTKYSPMMDKCVGGPQGILENPYANCIDYSGGFHQDAKALICHNRKTTVGATNVQNAHPFNYKSVYGVHNGTLTWWKDLHNSDKHDVDSKALIDHIGEYGIEDAWLNFHGAAAIVWWDDELQTINLVRNSQRPLSIALTADKKSLLWASEESILRYGLMRGKVEPLYEKTGVNSSVYSCCESLTPEMWVSFKVTAGSVERLEDKKLKNWVSPRVVGSPPTRGVGTNSAFFGVGNKKKKKELNKGWAQRLLKGDKDLRGIHIFPFSTTSRDTILFREIDVDGKVKSTGRCVEVYPKDTDQLQKFKRNIGAGSGRHLYTLNHRPRISKDERISDLSVSGDGISYHCFKLYPAFKLAKIEGKPSPNQVVLDHKGPYGRNVSELRWKELVDKSNNPGCCSSCGNPLASEEHSNYKWAGDDVIVCEVCSEDPTIVDYVEAMEGVELR